MNKKNKGGGGVSVRVCASVCVRFRGKKGAKIMYREKNDPSSCKNDVMDLLCSRNRHKSPFFYGFFW